MKITDIGDTWARMALPDGRAVMLALHHGYLWRVADPILVLTLTGVKPEKGKAYFSLRVDDRVTINNLVRKVGDSFDLEEQQ